MSQNTANGATTIKLEDQEQPTLNQQLESIDWDSERQLISSLAKLQELESKIHELRTLLPDRLLSPLNPIVNPRLPISPSSSSTPIPRNPQALSAALRKSAIEGVTEINDFKSLWNSADMQAIWSKVDEKLAETKGAFPQEGAAGMWKVEYDEVLREMDLEEQKEDGRDRMQTEVEVDDGEAQFPSSIYGSKEETASPKSVIESFQARQIPGFRVASTRNESTIVVSLGLAGLAFEIQEALTTESTATTSTTTATTSNATNKTSLPEWRVSTRQHSKPGLSGSGTSRLESAIVAQLNSRPRKWDLRFLLELILSYADIRSQPCKACNLLTDSVAQLPVLRRAVASSTTTTSGDGDGNGTGTGSEGVVWEGYHVGCI